MTIQTEASVWRDIVNATPVERGIYNSESLADYIDLAKQYFDELIKDVDTNDIGAVSEVLAELGSLIDDYEQLFGEMGEVRVQGNGIYIPHRGDDFKFFERSHGISGDFDGFGTNTVPTYQELLYAPSKHHRPKLTLCLELSDYREYSNTGISLEPSGGGVTIPIEGQDLCFTRVR